MAEDKKPSKAEGRYGKTEKKPMAKDKPAEKKAEPASDASDDKPAGDGKSAMMDMMRKRHEKEHRDLHGQHRDAMRDMFSRHETEMKDLHGQMGDMDPSATAGAGAPQPADGQVEAEAS